MGGEARGSTCSPNQLSSRRGWLEADVYFSFWCADHKHFFKCFFHLLIILPVLYIAFPSLSPICLLLQFINGRLHVLQVTWFHDVYIYVRCLETLLRLHWTSLLRATHHFREVTCHHDAWRLIWHQESYCRSSADCWPRELHPVSRLSYLCAKRPFLELV